MRWFSKGASCGDIKVVKRFLFFPLTIGNETRWFECVYILRRYLDVHHGWENVRFCDASGGVEKRKG